MEINNSNDLDMAIASLSQKNKVQSAWRALNDYESTMKENPDVSYLMKAKESIDLATANEETNKQPKTYAYRCRIMYNIFQFNLKAEQKKLEATIADKNARVEASYGSTSLIEFEEAGKALEKIKELDSKYFENIMNVLKGGTMPSDDDLKLTTHLIDLLLLKYSVKNITEQMHTYHK